MTRDEAIKAVFDAYGENDASLFVSRLVAIGILKLDEPKTAMEKFIQAMESQGYQRQSVGMRDAITAIKSAKIKFVDE